MLRWKCKSRLVWLLFSLLFFTVLWTFSTLFVIFAIQQSQNYNGNSNRNNKNDRNNAGKSGSGSDDYMGHGIQVVVGHYNGKLPDAPKFNLTPAQVNANRYAPAEGHGASGRPVRLSAAEEVEAVQLFSINQFNVLVSDSIPLNRSLPDVRKTQCRVKDYPQVLPTTTVIIVFHNEAYSTLLRTVTSVITRSPTHLLKEVMLVDDASERAFLRKPLEDALKSLPVRTVLLRASRRVGLIRARLMGAQESTGDVLTFLDSHCEVTEGWLEPLLARIKENRRTAVCPIIDVINDQNFAYQRGIELFRGGFNWNLQFRWYAIPPEEMHRRRTDPTEPIASPTMAGGLFSIDRAYFNEVGRYDDQMDIWGGENLEMSFRLWQCGGRIEILPCSHVGHIFRKASPHDFPDNRTGSILNTNLARAAEVWMDDWRFLFYKTAPQAFDMSKNADVSKRLALRRDLKCRNFEWYLTEVWKDHFLPMKGDFFGRFATDKAVTCLSSTPGEVGKRKHKLELKKCTLGFDMWQFWTFTKSGSIRSDEHQCLGASEVGGVWLVELRECAEVATELWHTNFKTGQVRHLSSQLCLDKRSDQNVSGQSKIPTLQKCAKKAQRTQTWEFLYVDWQSRKAYA